MAYTLWDFLCTQEGGDAVQLAGPTDLRRIPIEAVSVQELPVDDFIQKGDLVLSTAAGCLDNTAVFQKLISDVGNSSAAALFLSFKDSHYKVCRSILRQADDLALPLFILPWERHFSDVIKTINQALQAEKLKVYQCLQTDLFNAYFESLPIEEAAAMISRAFGAGVQIFRSNFVLLSQAGPISSPELSPEEIVDYPDILTLDIRVMDLTYGYLFLHGCVSGGEESGEVEQRTLLEKYVCFPLSLWFNRKNIEDLMALRLKNDFVWDLAHSSESEQEEMLMQGKRLNFDLKRPYACALLKVLPLEHLSADAPSYAKASTQIEDYLIQSGKAGKQGMMVSCRNLDFILYLSLPKSEPEAVVERFLDQLHESLSKQFPNYLFYWGISEISLMAPNFPKLYQNAGLALQYCMRSHSTRYRFTFQNTKEAQIVSVLSGDTEIKKFAEETLRPLIECNSPSSADLLETLATLIRCNYNVSLTARTLHIHRQSLLYRLDKIRELIGLSLDKHQDLFLLEISMRILSLYTI